MQKRFIKPIVYLIFTFSTSVACMGMSPDYALEKPVQLAQNKGGGDSNSSADGPASSAAGGLTLEDKSYVKDYHSKHRNSSVKYDHDISVGHQMPEGHTYYPLEGRQSLNGYNYTVINNRNVLVDPTTRRILNIID